MRCLMRIHWLSMWMWLSSWVYHCHWCFWSTRVGSMLLSTRWLLLLWSIWTSIECRIKCSGPESVNFCFNNLCCIKIFCINCNPLPLLQLCQMCSNTPQPLNCLLSSLCLIIVICLDCISLSNRKCLYLRESIWIQCHLIFKHCLISRDSRCLTLCLSHAVDSNQTHLVV